MAFVVDGNEWCFSHLTSAQLQGLIDNILERVQTARDRNETVWIGDDLQTRLVFGESDLWSLRAPDSPIKLSHETWQELAAWLNAAPRYFDEPVWPDGVTDIQVQIDGRDPEENADLAWVHHSVRAGRPLACLGMVRMGPHATSTMHGQALVNWVTDEKNHREFWRTAIDFVGNSEATLTMLSQHAFPDLYFHDGVFDGLYRLAGGYQAIRVQILRYLTVLDEHGKWVFVYPPPALDPGDEVAHELGALPSKQVIERRFHGLNLNMAPENPDVRAHKISREAREITIGQKTLYCEWHGKLAPHRNRLHIHPPVNESGDKVVIAIFDAHLPLP
jgi:hypothetical protein